ncbi:uncharacterized protein LOC129570354 [Sitodiplosis mosellana]|uniref:uncharacterized protein LOC129570354 n=1 Tax=Sitodiplosis mosellana TaxID=263140 RepID=UPI002443CF0F|nr:uncharacterized protein LOC129570354 [Sitodiplosis mosellana]
MALNISKVVFNHKISNISELDEEWTPEFMLQGVPWFVEFCKQIIDGQKWFGFYLFCSNKDELHDWSYTATSAFKFVPSDRKIKPKEIFPSPFIFNHVCDSWGSKIKWCDLFDAKNGFMKDDTINLEIQVEVADPNDEGKSVLKFDELDKCCGESGFASFRLTVSNIDALVAVRSPKFILRNMPWNIMICKNLSNHLGILLDHQIYDTNISCELKASFELVSSLGKPKCIKMERKQTMELDVDLMEIEQFVPCDQLLDEENGFVVNNEIIFEVEIKAQKLVGEMARAEKRAAAGGLSDEAKLLKLECSICLQVIRDQKVSSLPCSHLFCTKCIENCLKRRKKCPLCGAASYLNYLRRIRLPITN